LVKTLASQFIANKELLNNKVKEPSRSLELVSTKEQLENIQKLIEDANAEIKSHNNIVSDYSNQRNNLVQSIWKYLVESHKGTIDAFCRKFEGLEKGIES
jgi:wobble nucleotide-excising tRNase